MHFTEPVRDPLWGSILVSPEILNLLSSQEFSRLNRISQLGPASYIYPGATHTRKAHSLGVFHLAGKLLRALQGHVRFSETEIVSYLVAALCHDLGHFPYAHSLNEFSLEEHEDLASKMILAEPLLSLVAATGADPELTAAIIERGDRDNISGDLKLLRMMLSGVLDPDKLDYLNRDARYCGVPYGNQDIDFILQHLVVTKDGRLAVDERGIMSIEGILFSKYLMYKAVYWHRDVRSATAMIKKALFIALENKSLTPSELYSLDDHDFFALLTRTEGSSAHLASLVFSGSLYPQVFDVAFDPNREGHRHLLDLGQRARIEADFADYLKLEPLEILIDVPEAISFESELPVVVEDSREEIPFSESSTVFSQTLIKSFAHSLRRVRVFSRHRIKGIAKEAQHLLCGEAVSG